MKNPIQRRAFIVCLSWLTAAWGCYTVLKPRVPVQESGEQAYTVDWESVSFRNDCGACHNAETDMFHAMAVPPPRPAPSPQWVYYYETPWWVHYYAVPGSGSGGDAESPEEQKKRGFDRRQIAPAAEATANTLPPAAPAPPAGSVAKPRPAEGETAPQASTNDDNQKREGKRAIDSAESNRRTRKN